MVEFNQRGTYVLKDIETGKIVGRFIRKYTANIFKKDFEIFGSKCEIVKIK